MKPSTLAALMIDEGLRMEEHPGIVFRSGPTGRRAVIIGAADVWEVIRAVRSARESEPELTEQEVIEMVSSNSGLDQTHVRTAIEYWGSYPQEVDERIAQTAAAEQDAMAVLARTHELLTH